MMAPARRFDFLVVGSGLAGLYAAIRLAARGTVAVVTKRAVAESNSRYAQGGIAAVLGSDDRLQEHVADTVRTGAGLCHEDVVTAVVGEGPARVRELAELGVRFTRGPAGNLSLAQEGAHSHRRVAFADDRTGEEIVRALVARAHAEPQIHLLQNHMAIDLILRSRQRGERWPVDDDRCLGAFVLDVTANEVRAITAGVTILATGGAGKAYTYTSNPDVATGDGLAMAYRAGARLRNLEFVQFHPTCLVHPVARSFLITEATRGEGARLTTLDGTRFMDTYDERGELASRDVVARAIDAELKRRGDPHVYLHLEHLPAEAVRRRFPQIDQRCRALGFDITRQPLPVVPAAHYFCGGVAVDLDARTDLPGLVAVGEVAHTGMHGANRLASNSLLEAVVTAGRAVDAILAGPDDGPPPEGDPTWDPGRAVRVREAIILEHDWNHARRVMWDYVGIVRSDDRLAVAAARLDALAEQVGEYFRKYLLTPDLIELRNVALVASLVVRCARARVESRGLHYNVDHPHLDDEAWQRDTVVSRRGGAAHAA
jgi:L-aspartate oxidase